jgi:hypothetical protein
MIEADSIQVVQSAASDDFAFVLRSLRIEQSLKLRIAVIMDFARKDWALSGEEQQLGVRVHVANLVRRHEWATGVLLTIRNSGLLRIKSACHDLEYDRFLTQKV